MKIIETSSLENKQYDNLIIACNFNYSCNFSCSYCINNKFRKNFSKPLSKTALDNLIPYLPKLNKHNYTFYVAGGEPALYPHNEYFFSLLNKHLKNSKVIIGTNGSLIDNFTEIINNSKNINIELLVSLHTNQLSMDKYFSILKSFPYKENCKIKIMLNPGELALLQNTITKLKEYNYNSFIIQSIVIEQKLHPEYSKEEICFFKNNIYKEETKIQHTQLLDNNAYTQTIIRDDFILNSELINFKGLQCAAGNNSIRILPDGSVTLCYAHKGVTNFNLNQNKITELPTLHKSITCPSNRCACPAFTAIPKWDPNYCDPPEYFKGEIAD